MNLKLKITALLLFPAITAICQPILTGSGCNPVPGDRFVQFEVGTSIDSTSLKAIINLSGPNQVWDFSDKTLSKPLNYEASDTTDPTSATIPDDNVVMGLTCYKTSSTVLSELANHVGRQAIYSDPLDILRYPFTYLDSYTDTFESSVPGWFPINIGNVHVHADGYGTLIMANSTYTNVLRLVKSWDVYYYSTGKSYGNTYHWYVDGWSWAAWRNHHLHPARHCGA